MRFGFYLPTRGPGSTPAALRRLIGRAEALGFHSTMIADHVVWPVSVRSRYPYTVSGEFPGDGDALEQLSLLAWVAAASQRLRLVTSVMIVPHRNPVVTAKSIATIDHLSGGRVTVGVGVGWLREEFRALSAPPFEQRGRVTDEYLRLFKAIWEQDPVSFEGEFYRLEPVRALPKPVQKPHPPIWIGGHSRAALRRVAALGDGWHPVGNNPAVPLPPEELARLMGELERLLAEQGRERREITISYKAPVYDRPPGEGLRFSGTTDRILADVERFEALGVEELVLDFRSPDPGESLERMERFGAVIRACAPPASPPVHPRGDERP